MIIEEYEAKTLVRPSYPSLFAWMEYTLNPYQGCAHNCGYCDGKSERYRMHTDFGTKIRVKRNAPELLERFLINKGLRSVRMVQGSLFGPERSQPEFTLFIGGGVCDVYQPVEVEKRLMRQLLQLAYDYGVPVLILTKSELVLEDLDLLKKVNQETHAGVSLTITLADKGISKIFEPGASGPEERFHTIQQLREAGINSGVYLMPILPFIGDTDANLDTICSKAKASGAEFVHAWGLTLTPGRNKEEFFHTLEDYFPKMLPKYRLLYGNNDRYGKFNPRIATQFSVASPELKAFRLIYESGLDYTAKRFIPAGRIRSNLRVSEVLMRAAYLKGTFLGTWQEAKRLIQGAILLEKLEQDVFELSREQLNRIGLPSETHPYLAELFLGDCSKSLTELEKQVYQRSLL